MRRRMRWAAIAASTAAALVLAGCAGIPTGGPVGSVAIDAEDGDGKLLTLPDSPQKGATPEQILAGFLRAQRAPQGNYSIAREFLTEEFRLEWSPTELVRVSDSPIVPQQEGGEASLRVNVNVQASVDATGVYTELPHPESQELAYEFARDDDGEWRIARAPAGTVLSSRGFDMTFLPYPLYFFDPSGTALVPDVRWFPDTASRADRIVKQLLAGPAPWYRQGVLVTSFPSGTTLDPGVTISGGTATVELSAGVASEDADALWRMQQQLRLSLVALSEVKDVRMVAGGFPVQVGEGRAAESAFVVGTDPVGLAEGGFGHLTASTVDPLPGLSSPIEDLGATGATVGRGDDMAAVRTQAGAWLVRPGEDPLLVDGRPGVIDPSIDAQGFVWSAVGADADSIIAVDASGQAHALPAPNLDGAIVSLDVSRDGTRLLIGTQGAGGPGLTIAGIVRDGDGVPTGFGDPLRLAITSATLLDATWVDSSTVAALSRDGEATEVDAYGIGGRHESLGQLAGGVQIVGGNFVEGIRVRDDDGAVWRRSSTGSWLSTGIVASFLATQQ